MSESMFHIFPFLAGLVFGGILVYCYKDQKVIIMDYPIPYDKKIHSDANGMKFQYITKEVNCDANEKNIKPYPIQ